MGLERLTDRAKFNNFLIVNCGIVHSGRCERPRRLGPGAADPGFKVVGHGARFPKRIGCKVGPASFETPPRTGSVAAPQDDEDFERLNPRDIQALMRGLGRFQ